MNPIIDPLQGDFPEVIEEFLEHGIMKCISFNRRGTLLAAGCSDGSCVVWDFETRGIAKELRDKDCAAAITSVCWSRNGHNILISAADKSLTLWDVVKGEKIYRITLQQTPLQARLHPLESTLCLICPFSSAPIIVDLRTETTTTLPISLSEKPAPTSKNKFSDGSAYTPTAACFNKYGDLVYVGNSVGEILIIDHKKNQVCGIVPISGGAVIKNIVFSRDGQFLLTNSSDRTIRIYENLLKQQDSHKLILDEILPNSENEVEMLKGAGTNCLSLFREFQDSITKVHWKAPCFSGDGEWVVGGSASKGEHKIYIWDRRAGHLVKILEGPKEALMDLVWHPVHPIVVSVSLTGLVYIWAKDYTENWSAFAPDFKELEENEEYVEREDEFDLMPETEKVKESETNEEDEVDITTVEKDSAFSDSEEELCFLPADPCPDPDVSGDKHTGRRDNSSPLSEDNNGYSNQVEGPENSGGEDTGGVTHLKRRRKPSEKVLEQQQAQKVQKSKASGKSLKPKSKFGNEQEEENDMNHFGDENGFDD
ncbi:putative transcription factor WD40-like family [Helianthus annuus]|uniref:Putative transducin/WD40 repeat-like superfamily protein n=1 Tax=Helianthus annuus TaxID=4232 RepID=A0A251TW65_HELAN|nr:protein RBL [Helianthus annuus]KAF5791167.1 putative transcription factor WD40-like family [Helianthus annuus]KAJ0534681.1 putative transcription factor WD40-like family [Helianthus annuus]KAJ0542672.1 putative transcription factor WD40-like family [Helianthus annuus]KAJ0888559.1 putative transcription factor WD40-like family [Helianthus annuus]KAJ0893433.1 putative transcription factor WD40-like family [Helianthus annuus]